MADQPTIQLADPIDVGGEVVSSVTLGAIRAKHLRKIAEAKTDFDASFEMVCAVSGLTAQQADELTASDFTAIAEAAADFLPEKG